MKFYFICSLRWRWTRKT